MTKKGERVNKFLPPFDKDKAIKLKTILEPLENSAFSISGIIHSLEDILERPSYMRECDINLMKEVFKAIEKI